MPVYPFECPKCQSYDEVWATMSKMPKSHKCPECGADMNRVYTSTQINMQDSFHWENENGGRGRKIDSLKRKHWDEGPHLYKRNRQELIETYKSKELRHDVC